MKQQNIVSGGEFKMLCESSLNDEKTNDLMTDIDTHIVL